MNASLHDWTSVAYVTTKKYIISTEDQVLTFWLNSLRKKKDTLAQDDLNAVYYIIFRHLEFSQNLTFYKILLSRCSDFHKPDNRQTILKQSDGIQVD